MLKLGAFYFSITKKMVATFGTIFNEIVVPRFDDDGNVTQVLNVPISYSPKEKVLARLKGDPNIDHKAALTLPRISFELTSVEYDASRKLNSIQTVRPVQTSNGSYQRQFVSVPYNFHFSLWVYAKNVEDGLTVIEQILPFFTPEFPTKLNLIPEMNISHNVPVILNSVQSEDTYAGDFKDDNRQIIWSLDFTMKGHYYGPIRSEAIIKFANVNFYAPAVDNLADAVGNSAPIERVTSQPGLTANGQPTSNISLTIPYLEIEANDDYGFINLVVDPSANT
jgi:hypothetical protein